MLPNHTNPDPATAQSSRLFVKNLPPNITEADFLKHFSAQGRPVTDIKLIPHRRIGFVGYKSHDDAARAVKYFNRSFIRMSRINCDLAKPIEDSVLKRVTKNSSKPNGAGAAAPSPVAAMPKQDPSANKRKRDSLDEADPKLQEFLEVMGHPTKKSRDSKDAPTSLPSDVASPVPAVSAVLGDEESDDEYETIPVRSSKPPSKDSAIGGAGSEVPVTGPGLPAVPTPVEAVGDAPQVAPGATDDDWLRSRTNRLLDLVDPNDPGFALRPAAGVSAVPASTHHAPPSGEQEESTLALPAGTSKVSQKARDPLEQIEETSRLFLRNLSYHVSEEDIRDHFSTFGELVEVNLPRDKEGKVKGFAMIQYEQPSSAVAAFQTDGSTFQGRIIHILPAAAKRNVLDEYTLSQLPLKKQQLLRKKAEAASSRFNWNSLFMSQDAVNAAVAERLGVSKHELLDPTDASAAVKQAVAETTVIKEAKNYFAANGVNIDAFKSQERGDTTILVKNIANTTTEDLRQLFEEHGTVLRVLMPPSGTIAIVQFAQPAQCRVAFAKKAYSRCKSSILFLEKGPKGLLTDAVAPQSDRPSGLQKTSAAELLERDDAEDHPETSSLFVRNLNFSTTSDDLANAFRHLAGFVRAQVKTKTDPKKPGQILSMGFGFCAFHTKEQAQAAQKAMDGFVLAAHKLSVKASHRGLDAAEEQRQKDLAKKAAGQRTKLVIKNLPFEMSKKEVRELFSNYGKLISIRIPKKFDQSSRGFAFAEFSTAKEALNAMTALKDTHLLGRRLVIEFSEAEEIDPEEQIKAMEKKMRGQANKVALQQLTGRNRTKVNIGNDDEDQA